MSLKAKRCRKSGKVKYDTHERALIRAGELLTNPDANMRMIKSFNAYLCPDCGKYHLTTKAKYEMRVRA